MKRWPCGHLGGSVELTAERERHIGERHPDLARWDSELIAGALREPDQVRVSDRMGNARLFSRWYGDVQGGVHAVVVVISDPPAGRRHWVVTAYLARRLSGGRIEWQRS